MKIDKDGKRVDPKDAKRKRVDPKDAKKGDKK